MARTTGQAGRSAGRRFEVEWRRSRRRQAEVTVWLGLVALLVLLAVVARTWVPALAAAVPLGLAVVRRPAADPQRWRRGATGEEATAELLDHLGRRWEVLHDRRLPGSRANIDHLVVGRRGVWLLDSKAYRAPLRTGLRSVQVGERRLDTSGVAWLAEAVTELVDVEVRPLIVVHTGGDRPGLPLRGRRCDGVRVIPAAGALRRVRREHFGPRRAGAARRALADLLAEVLPEA